MITAVSFGSLSGIWSDANTPVPRMRANQMLVVTTAFYRSLSGCKTNRCRRETTYFTAALLFNSTPAIHGI